MSEGKAPLCDGHYREMSPHRSTLCREDVFKCGAVDCGRYYTSRYGYFNMLPGEPVALGKIDPADRRMKVCSATQHAHSYMAITRPKNSSPGTRALWCWHCYTCTKTR